MVVAATGVGLLGRARAGQGQRHAPRSDKEEAYRSRQGHRKKLLLSSPTVQRIPPAPAPTMLAFDLQDAMIAAVGDVYGARRVDVDAVRLVQLEFLRGPANAGRALDP